VVCIVDKVTQIMTTLFSIFYWTFVGSTSIVLFLGALLIWCVTMPFDRTGTFLHHYSCWWARLYLRCLPGCRIHVEGREKILPHTPYVLVANHQSLTDVMALSALAVPFKWLSKKENFRIPFIGWNMYLNRTIRVDRGNMRGVPQMMARCRYWLQKGIPLMIFPEGHRSRTGEMIKFHGGAFKLAAECACAVIPIVVNGTLPIYQGLRVAAFPGDVTVQVLDPVSLTDAQGSITRFRDLVFDRMKEALARIRGTMVKTGSVGAGKALAP
jgi:1-acyl-sn-glycerol-3-phosphate acyltransferase